MEEQQSNSNTRIELQGLTIKELFYKYIRFLPFFLLSLAIALFGAWLYLRYTTKIYGATGTMLINNEKQQPGRTDKVEDLISGSGRTQNIQNEMEVLRSKPLMKRVVKKLGLDLEYRSVGKVKELNIYTAAPFYLDVLELQDSVRGFTMEIAFQDNQTFSVNKGNEQFSYNQLFKNEFGVFRLLKRNVQTATGVYKVIRQNEDVVAAGLASGIRVAPKINGTGILNINLQATNAQLAADVVNSLMVQYDSLSIEQNNYSNDQTISFIDGRLEKLKSEADSIMALELVLRQQEELFNAEAQGAGYLDKLRETNKLVSEIDLKVEAIDIIADYIKDKKNRYSEVVPSSLGLDDLTLNELVAGYNRAQLERQALLNASIPAGNPAVKEADGLIEKQRESLRENLKNIRMSYLDQVSAMQKGSLADKQYLKQLPYKVKDLLDLQRQINTKLTTYSLLENKREETAISRAATVSNSKVVEKATASTVPVSPNKRTVQLIAVLLGLGLPALIIFLAELLNDKITSRHEIERNTNTPILGEVGHSYSENTLVVNRTSRGMVAEQFRIIRSNLQYVLTKKENPVILVTSSFSGEGKSFVSTNVAAVMALTGKKTVILEFDIRKPKVLSGLNMSRKAGISNYLVGKGDLEELIVPVPDIENLFVLPCGPIPPNPSELLLDERVTEMFDRLRKSFDVVVIDTAPVGMVSDALTLSRYADCTLYLVRQGHTFKKQIVLIDELYNENKLPKVSIVVNDVKLKSGYGYYGYGRYGYGYGYGEKGGYYDEEVKPRGFWDRLLDSLNPLRWFKRKK